jgi:hypothetical protein
MRARTLGVLVGLGLVVAGCATQPAPDAYGAPGFFVGLWHGFTAMFSLIGGLFLHVRVYAFPNSGWGYDFGFILGFGTWGGLVDALVKLSQRLT